MRALLAVLALTVVAALGGGGWFGYQQHEQIAALEVQVADLEHRVDAVDAEASAARSNVESLSEAIAAAASRPREDPMERIDDLEEAVFGPFGAPSIYGPSLEDQIERLQGDVDSLCRTVGQDYFILC